MPAYIQITPKFDFNPNNRSVWCTVDEGVMTMQIQPNYIILTLYLSDGSKLERLFIQSPSRGCRVESDPMNDYEEPGRTAKQKRDEEFWAVYRAEPEKLAKGIIMANIYDQSSYKLIGVKNMPSINLVLNVMQDCIPFPVELPNFSVKLTLLSD